MSRNRSLRLRAYAAFTVLMLLPAPAGVFAQFSGPSSSASSALSIPQSQLIQPEALHKILEARGAAKPILLQVGSHVMFSQAHIPGSQYAGPGSQQAGLAVLSQKVAGLPKAAFIVIYCGCCPWNRCPNIGPAFEHLRSLGFTNVKALYIPNNFGDDWAGKGYGVESGG